MTIRKQTYFFRHVSEADECGNNQDRPGLPAAFGAMETEYGWRTDSNSFD